MREICVGASGEYMIFDQITVKGKLDLLLVLLLLFDPQWSIYILTSELKCPPYQSEVFDRLS